MCFFLSHFSTAQSQFHTPTEDVTDHARFVSLFQAINQNGLVSMARRAAVYRSTDFKSKGMRIFCFSISSRTFCWLHAKGPCKVVCAVHSWQQQQLHPISDSPGGKRHIADIFYLFSDETKKRRKSISLNIYWHLSLLHVTPKSDVFAWVLLLNFIILFSFFSVVVVKRTDLMWNVYRRRCRATHNNTRHSQDGAQRR